MPLAASKLGTSPLSVTVNKRNGCKDEILQTSCVMVSTGIPSCDLRSVRNKLVVPGPTKLVKQLHPVQGRKHPNVNRSASVIACVAAWNARCSASGQTQTLTRETSTKAPVREPTKTPKLDDSGPALPPRGGGGGGGGGGDGGGNFFGGFFLFGFLGFLGFLKDIESDYRDNRGR